MRTGASVLPLSVEREGTGARHVVRLREPIPMKGEDPADLARLNANVEAMNRALEDLVRSAPTQWSWLHRRWRTRPDPSEPGPYPSRHGRPRPIAPPAPGPERSAR